MSSDRRERWLSAARAASLLVLLGMAGCASSPPSGAPAAERSITILTMNDVYRIEGLDDGKVGGLARLRTLRAELEARSARTRAAAPRRRRDLPVAPEPRVPGQADDRRHEPPRRRCHARPHRRADARRLRQSRVRFRVVRRAAAPSGTGGGVRLPVAVLERGARPLSRRSPAAHRRQRAACSDPRRRRDPGRPLRAHDPDPAQGRRVPRSPRDGHRPHRRPAPARRRGRHRRHSPAEGGGRADLRGTARARPRPDRRRTRARAHGAAARRHAAHLQGRRGCRDGVGHHAPPRIRRPRARRAVPAQDGRRDPARPRSGRARRPVAGAARGGVLRQAGQAGLLSGRAPGDDPHAAHRRGREGPRRGDVRSATG